MSTLLKDLNYPDAVLLMYLANELPADDRAVIDERLEHQPELHDKLDELRAAYGAVDAFIGAADGASRVASGFTAARQLGDVVRDRQRRLKPEDSEVLQRRRGWWMIYPVAAAALICIAMLAWYRSTKDEMTRPAGNDPMVSARDWNHGFPGGPGGGFGFSGGFGLTAPPDMGGNIATMDDDTLKQMFDPMVNDRSAGFVNRQLSAIQLMNDGTD